MNRFDMRRVFIFFALILLGIQVSGQVNKYGVPIIRNYSTQITHGSEQNWCITRDSRGNLYFGNNNSGVLQYDGTKWSDIQIGNNPRIFSLESDTRGIVYVGAAFEFGYIQPDERGTPEYVSLASRLDSITKIGIVYSIVEFNGSVHFLSSKFLFIYDISGDSLNTIPLSRFNLNEGYNLVIINNKIIISDNVKGLLELKDTIITPLEGGNFFKNMSCTVLLPCTENKILVGTFNNGLFLYDLETGIVKNDFIKRQLNEKLKDVSVYAGAKLSEGIFAIGTTNQEGILIFNSSGKLLQQIHTENSDLEDNTVYAMYCDFVNNGELWISTHGVISKAYLNIPVTEFAEKQGIESGVNRICNFQGNIYLSTDRGILKRITDSHNNTVFKKVKGLNTQVFPIEVFKTPAGDELLAGTLDGIVQISKKDMVRSIENSCINLPLREESRYNARIILQSSVNPEICYFGLDVGGIIILNYNGTNWRYINTIKNVLGEIASIVEEKEGSLWILTDDPPSLYRLNFTGQDTTLVKYGPENGIFNLKMSSISYIRNELCITTATGILKYDRSIDKFVIDNSLTNGYSENNFVMNLFPDEDDDLWYSGIDEATDEILFRNTEKGIETYQGVLKLLPNVPLMDIFYLEGKVYLLKSKKMYVVDKSKLIAETNNVNTSFVKITVGGDSVIIDGTFYKNIDKNRRIPSNTSNETTVPAFSYNMNELSFEWTSPYFTEELQTQYSYKLEGFEKEWSKWEGISFGYTMEALYSNREYTNLPYGHYTFKVRTKTLTGLIGKELNYEFNILKPWYATVIAYIGFVLLAIIIIYFIIKAYTKKLINENIRLEGIVVERTAVVVKQKEELESSIHYASRIQMALLPSKAILSENIRKSFVLFKPRDIVSGDFYWMTKKGERLYIVAADCTGHGVPGAFMSLLGMSFLDEIIEKDRIPRADDVLNELRLHVTESLKQVGDDDEAKDGMDLAILVIDFGTERIEFSGAYNPCLRVRKLTKSEEESWRDESLELDDGSMTNGKYLLETINASKMPIGISSRMDEKFVFQDWPIEKGVAHYLFSDGYVDQFGGPKGRKFMKKNFKRLILDIQDYPIDKQKEMLDDNLSKWMDDTPQIDDILVMGIIID
jgi:Y_Y_Y domain